MKLVVTSSPHIRGDFRTSRLMLDVVLALIPALIVGTIVLGFRALLVTLISMAAAVAAEWAAFAAEPTGEPAGAVRAAEWAPG